MRKMLLFFALFGFVLFFGCASNEKVFYQETGAKLLNQQDLIEFFKEKRVATWQTNVYSGKIYYYPNGTMENILSEDPWDDEGEYRIENGQICAKWRKTRGGKEQCCRLYHGGENKYVFVKLDGSIAFSPTSMK